MVRCSMYAFVKQNYKQPLVNINTSIYDGGVKNMLCMINILHNMCVYTCREIYFLVMRRFLAILG